MVKKVTSLKIDDVLWKDVKIHCIKENLDLSEFLEKIVKKELKK